MTRVSFVLPCLMLVACAVESPVPQSSLMEGKGDVPGVKGLERLERSGVYESSTTERFRVHLDEAQIARLEWSASSGALSTSGRVAEWTLPNLTSAELSLRVVRRDGSEGTATWRFAITPTVDSSRPMTAQAALLAMPMPVLDGGSLEVSGGGCEVRYEGSTANVGIAFTTATHPSLMYGRWNGSAWSLEVVDAMGFNTGGVINQHVSMQVEPNGTPHLVYIRDNTVMYATKSGANWLRERVDAPSTALAAGSVSGTGESVAPSITLVGSSPVVLFLTGVSYSTYRPLIATRTAANTWTRTIVTVPGLATTDGQYPLGELVIDASGRHLFPVSGYSAGTQYLLVSWTAGGTTTASLPSLPGRASMALAGPSRLYALSGNGVMDVQLSTPLSASTLRTSLVETFSTTQHAIATDAAGLPRLIVNHGSTLEVVRSAGSPGFWDWLELGPADSGLIDVSVNGADETRACFVRAGKLMLY